MVLPLDTHVLWLVARFGNPFSLFLLRSRLALIAVSARLTNLWLRRVHTSGGSGLGPPIVGRVCTVLVGVWNFFRLVCSFL